jgi:hypothetical protein
MQDLSSEALQLVWTDAICNFMKYIALILIRIFFWEINTEERCVITVKGQVIDSNGKESAPFINIHYGNQISHTDKDGNFALDIDTCAIKSITFRFLGYADQTVELKELVQNPKVQLSYLKHPVVRSANFDEIYPTIVDDDTLYFAQEYSGCTEGIRKYRIIQSQDEPNQFRIDKLGSLRTKKKPINGFDQFINEFNKLAYTNQESVVTIKVKYYLSDYKDTIWFQMSSDRSDTLLTQYAGIE